MKLSERILKLLGWRIEGFIPKDLKKYVLIAVPHTSWWDFPLGLLARNAIGRNIRFIGKKSLFKPPFGWIMKALGGYPVDRSKRMNFVDSIIKIFDEHEEFEISMAPEGTRKRVDRFKTGFYYIAKGAKVPIVLVSFDYANKVVKFDPEPFYPGDDVEKDMEYLWNYYRGVKGKVPENSIL